MVFKWNNKCIWCYNIEPGCSHLYEYDFKLRTLSFIGKTDTEINTANFLKDHDIFKKRHFTDGDVSYVMVIGKIGITHLGAPVFFYKIYKDLNGTFIVETKYHKHVVGLENYVDLRSSFIKDDVFYIYNRRLNQLKSLSLGDMDLKVKAASLQLETISELDLGLIKENDKLVAYHKEKIYIMTSDSHLAIIDCKDVTDLKCEFKEKFTSTLSRDLYCKDAFYVDSGHLMGINSATNNFLYLDLQSKEVTLDPLFQFSPQEIEQLQDFSQGSELRLFGFTSFDKLTSFPEKFMCEVYIDVV